MTHPLRVFNYCPRCGTSSFEENNRYSKKCASCGFIYYQNPRAAVAAFIHNTQGDLLVCRRRFDPAAGTFDLPGGFTDIGETAEEAILREVYEETRLEVTSTEYCFSHPNTYLYSGMEIPTMDLFFRCEVKEMTSLQSFDDVSELFFIPLNQLNPDQFGLSSIAWAIARYQRENATNINKT